MRKPEIKMIAGAVIAVGAAVAALVISLNTDSEDTQMKFRELTSGHTAVTHQSERINMSAAASSTAPLTTAEVTSAQPVTAEVTTETYIDINSADVQELCRLRNIGEARAEAIIAYRNEHGRFNNIEEIMLVSGIGEEIFGQIAGNIYVTDPVYPSSETAAEAETETTETVTSEAITVPETEVPSETETETETEPTSIIPETTENKPKLEDVQPIDINRADAEELMLLPYVDEHTAELIIALREDIGGFRHPYELLYIDELTQKQVAEIVKFVTVGQ